MLQSCGGDSTSCLQTEWGSLADPSPLGTECDSACLVPLAQCVASNCGSCLADASGEPCSSCLAGAPVASQEDSCLNGVLTCVLGINCLQPSSYHDSTCDEVNNVEGCGYDGGDCCKKTCQATQDLLSGETSMCPFVLDEDDDLECIDLEALAFEGFCGNLNALPYVIERQVRTLMSVVTAPVESLSCTYVYETCRWRWMSHMRMNSAAPLKAMQLIRMHPSATLTS